MSAQATKDELEMRVAERTAELTAKLAELTREKESLVATMRNQLEQRVAERTAELSRERLLLRTLIDNLPDYIFVKDTQSRFVIANTACTRQLGASHPHEVIGKSDADFVTAELAEEYLKAEQALMQSDRAYDKQELFLHKETGEKRWALTTKVSLRDESGRVIGLMGIARDITTIKESEKRLEAVHKELRDVSRQAGMAEVATGVLHNVGNVLNSVNVAAGVVADRLQNSKAAGITKLSTLLLEHNGDLGRFLSQDERGRHVPAYLKQLAEHLEQERAEMHKELHELILNIEHIKEIVATQQNYARVLGVAEAVHLPDLMEDAIRIHGGAYERHGIKLVREYQPLPALTVDKHKVMQIIVNFLNNAKYACDAAERPDKQVIVRLTRSGETGVKIEIVDNGVGIVKENLTRIFSQGFTTRKGGHGFGLHSGALAAMELGGTVSVHSDGPGKGSTFVLELPLTPPADLHGKARTPTAAAQ